MPDENDACACLAPGSNQLRDIVFRFGIVAWTCCRRGHAFLHVDNNQGRQIALHGQGSKGMAELGWQDYLLYVNNASQAIWALPLPLPLPMRSCSKSATL